jgi:hypothetical protein
MNHAFFVPCDRFAFHCNKLDCHATVIEPSYKPDTGAVPLVLISTLPAHLLLEIA